MTRPASVGTSSQWSALIAMRDGMWSAQYSGLGPDAMHPAALPVVSRHGDGFPPRRSETFWYVCSFFVLAPSAYHRRHGHATAALQLLMHNAIRLVCLFAVKFRPGCPGSMQSWH